MHILRCYSCNTYLAAAREEAARCKDLEEAFAKTTLRLCCRRMLLSDYSVTGDILPYSRTRHEMDDCGTVLDMMVEGERTVSCD